MKPLLGQGLPRSSVQHLPGMGLKGDDAARIIRQVAEATESDLVAGAAITVTNRRLALRRLPLIADDHTNSQ